MGVENIGYCFQEAIANMELYSNSLWKQYSADNFDIAYARIRRNADDTSQRFEETTIGDIMASIKISSPEESQLFEEATDQTTTSNFLNGLDQTEKKLENMLQSQNTDTTLHDKRDETSPKESKDVIDPDTDDVELFLHPFVDEKVGQQLQSMDSDEELDLGNNPMLIKIESQQQEVRGTTSLDNPYWEAVKTVGMRLGGIGSHNDFVVYNNPFDPRLYFNGLLPSSASTTETSEDYAAPCSYPPATQNVLLGVNNISDLVEHHTSQHKRVIDQLCNPHLDDHYLITLAGSHVNPEDDIRKISEEVPIDTSNLTEEEIDVMQRVVTDDVKRLWGKCAPAHPEDDGCLRMEEPVVPVGPGPIKRPNTVPWSSWPQPNIERPLTLPCHKTSTTCFSFAQNNKRKLDTHENANEHAYLDTTTPAEFSAQQKTVEESLALVWDEPAPNGFSEVQNKKDIMFVQEIESEYSAELCNINSPSSRVTQHFLDDNDLFAVASPRGVNDPELNPLAAEFVFPKRSMSDPDIHRSAENDDLLNAQQSSVSCQILAETQKLKKSKPLNPEALDYFPSVHVSNGKDTKVNKMTDWFSAVSLTSSKEKTKDSSIPKTSQTSAPSVAKSKLRACAPNFIYGQSSEVQLVKAENVTRKVNSAKNLSQHHQTSTSRKMKQAGRNINKMKQASIPPWKRQYLQKEASRLVDTSKKHVGDSRGSAPWPKQQQDPVQPVFKPDVSVCHEAAKVLPPAPSTSQTSHAQLDLAKAMRISINPGVHMPHGHQAPPATSSHIQVPNHISFPHATPSQHQIPLTGHGPHNNHGLSVNAPGIIPPMLMNNLHMPHGVNVAHLKGNEQAAAAAIHNHMLAKSLAGLQLKFHPSNVNLLTGSHPAPGFKQPVVSLPYAPAQGFNAFHGPGNIPPSRSNCGLLNVPQQPGNIPLSRSNSGLLNIPQQPGNIPPSSSNSGLLNVPQQPQGHNGNVHNGNAVKPPFGHQLPLIPSEHQLHAQVAMIQAEQNQMRILTHPVNKISSGIGALTTATQPLASFANQMVANQARHLAGVPHIHPAQPSPAMTLNDHAANAMKKIEFNQLVNEIMHASKPNLPGNLPQQLHPFIQLQQQHHALLQQQAHGVPTARPSDVNIHAGQPNIQPWNAASVAQPQGLWNATANVRWPGLQIDKPIHEPFLAQMRPSVKPSGHRLF